MKNPNAKPMLFTKENRAKNITGDKTMTRRVIKGSPNHVIWNPVVVNGHGGWCDDHGNPISPKYKVGDIVYQQEPYIIESVFAKNRVVAGKYLDDNNPLRVSLTIPECNKWLNRKYPHRKTSARYMYKSLARYFYRINRVWVEQVQDIAIGDITKEGIILPDEYRDNDYSVIQLACKKAELWKSLWESIHGDGAYERNDWVICYEYERIE